MTKNFKRFKEIEFIKSSDLDKNLKKSILWRLKNMDDDEKYTICDLDDCMDFLERQGFKVWDLTPDEDNRLENFLKKYFSEKLKGFPLPITTEDFVELYHPQKTFNYTQDQLPSVLPKVDKELYKFHASFLEERMGRQHFFGNFLPKEECEYLKKLFEGDLKKLLFMSDRDIVKYLYDSPENFKAKLKDVIKFKAPPDPFTIEKCTQREIYEYMAKHQKMFDL